MRTSGRRCIGTSLGPTAAERPLNHPIPLPMSAFFGLSSPSNFARICPFGWQVTFRGRDVPAGKAGAFP